MYIDYVLVRYCKNVELSEFLLNLDLPFEHFHVTTKTF